MTKLDRKILPKGWRWAKLWEVCQRPITTHDPTRRPDAEFTYVDISGVDNQRKCIVEPKSLLGRNAPSRARQVIKAGDIILATTRPNLNAVALVPKELDNQICSTGFCVLRPIPEFLSGDFLFFWVRHPDFVENLADLVKGALYPAVTDNQVLAQYIPLPPLPEQKRIAVLLKQQLATVERARKASEARLAAARALPAAYLREVFESEEAEDWPQSQLLDICISNGQYGTSQKSNASQKGLPVLGMKHIQDGQLAFDNFSYVDLPEHEMKKYILCSGDIVFNRTNSADLVGKTAVFDLEDKVVFASYLIRFRADKSRADPRFVSAFINSRKGREFIEENMTRAIGQVNISASTMHEMFIPMPPISLQKRIMDNYDEKRRSVNLLNKILLEQDDFVLSLPSALLNQAFSGAI